MGAAKPSTGEPTMLKLVVQEGWNFERDQTWLWFIRNVDTGLVLADGITMFKHVAYRVGQARLQQLMAGWK